MTLEDLVEALRRDVPEVHDLLRAHLAALPGGDEFVLMGLLRERALELFEEGRTGALDRLLGWSTKPWPTATTRSPTPSAATSSPPRSRGTGDGRLRGRLAGVLRAQAAIETARSQDP